MSKIIVIGYCKNNKDLCAYAILLEAFIPKAGSIIFSSVELEQNNKNQLPSTNEFSLFEERRVHAEVFAAAAHAGLLNNC